LEQVLLELTGPSADRVDRPTGPGQAELPGGADRALWRGGPDRADGDRR
jgi:hypothetical protein